MSQSNEWKCHEIAIKIAQISLPFNRETSQQQLARDSLPFLRHFDILHPRRLDFYARFFFSISLSGQAGGVARHWKCYLFFPLSFEPGRKNHNLQLYSIPATLRHVSRHIFCEFFVCSARVRVENFSADWRKKEFLIEKKFAWFTFQSMLQPSLTHRNKVRRVQSVLCVIAKKTENISEILPSRPLVLWELRIFPIFFSLNRISLCVYTKGGKIWAKNFPFFGFNTKPHRLLLLLLSPVFSV